MSRRTIAMAGALAAAVALSVIFLNDPAETQWMPRCLLRTLTGYQCPSCGITRAAHQLMHGHLREALMLNPMLPVLLAMATLIIWRLTQPGRYRQRTTIVMVYIYVALYIAWGVVRNIIGV